MKKTFFFSYLLIFTFMLALSGCVTPPTDKQSPRVSYHPVAFDDIPGWSQDTLNEAWAAWLMSCRAFKKNLVWQEVCAAAENIDASSVVAVRAFFENRFDAYQILIVSGTDATGEGLITGYYEPLLRGSRVPDALYRFPLYANPADLLTVELASLYPELADKRVRGRLEGNKIIPYYSRAEIDRGQRTPDAKILLYLDDALDAFFLHIQGSGRVRLPNNEIVRIGYADQNGHPYRAIGAILIERGELTRDDVSMQAIKNWGRQHPEQLPALLDENPSYIFFREIPSPTDPLAIQIDGPIGSFGVPLLAQRAIAVDRNKIPLGAPVFVVSTFPDQTPLQHLTMAQDTGGAIRGALRADFFCGAGDEAGEIAGKMKQRGQLWLLWPKGKESPQPK
ncbi:MAG: MltA domain-containing protein [Burkholderiales bacterium]|jgi:membrane-bound lytic murein transglycosylase A|nr:MltA domain-containing protein [Burkholderiales bacterium]